MTRIIVKENQDILVPLLWIGKETELTYDIVLSEPGSRIRFLGLLFGKNNDKLKLNIKVTHAAPQTSSEVIIKSALLGNAKADVAGLVKILPGAKGTKAWLAAKMLLLSGQAKAQVIPALEILENDVKAGHAATVGRISDAEMFYLMSRGLPYKAARRVIVNGFMQDTINSFPKELAIRARALAT